MSSITPQDAVDCLNSMLEADRPAIAALVANRVPCNEILADHPTCQCGAQHGGFNVGMLGVINGLFGIDENMWGPIQAEFEDDPDGNWQRLARFSVRTSE